MSGIFWCEQFFTGDCPEVGCTLTFEILASSSIMGGGKGRERDGDEHGTQKVEQGVREGDGEGLEMTGI